MVDFGEQLTPDQKRFTLINLVFLAVFTVIIFIGIFGFADWYLTLTSEDKELFLGVAEIDCCPCRYENTIPHRKDFNASVFDVSKMNPVPTPS